MPLWPLVPAFGRGPLVPGISRGARRDHLLGFDDRIGMGFPQSGHSGRLFPQGGGSGSLQTPARSWGVSLREKTLKVDFPHMWKVLWTR